MLKEEERIDRLQHKRKFNCSIQAKENKNSEEEMKPVALENKRFNFTDMDTSSPKPLFCLKT